MPHDNEGFDIKSRAEDGTWVFIEVKGHKPSTTDIKVSVPQIRHGKQMNERFRLAVVEVPEDPEGKPNVNYIANPFAGTVVDFAESSRTFKVRRLASRYSDPV